MAAAVECPEGWMDATIVSYHLGCLKFVLDKSHSWGDAYRYCRQRDSHLVEFYSSTEIHYVMAELRAIESILGMTKNYWVGGTDWGSEGKWYMPNFLKSWPNTSSSYEWAEGEPNQGLEGNYMCLIASADYQAADCNEQEMHSFICQQQE